jgi:hypothetical protein
MLFAFSDPSLTFFAMFSIVGVWAFYFFVLRDKPEDKSQ